MGEQELIRDVCKREFGEEPIKVHRLSSLTNAVHKLDFDKRGPVIFKLLNNENPNLFLFQTKKTDKMLQDAGFLKDVLLVDKDEYRVERFIESREIKCKDQRDHDTRIMLMRPIAEYHNLFPAKGKDDAFVIETWKKVMPEIKKKIEKNYAGGPIAHKVAAIVAEIENYVQNTLFSSPLFSETVFSHNDLLAGNLLFNKEVERYMLIDYEYSGYSAPESDIYNILIESTYEYDDTFPQAFVQDHSVFPMDKEVKELIHFYLFFRRHEKELTFFPDNEKSVENFRKHPGFAAIPEADIEAAFERIYLVGNIQNLYWCLWSFYVQKKQGAAMDYPAYGFARFHDFQETREKFEQVTFDAQAKKKGK